MAESDPSPVYIGGTPGSAYYHMAAAGNQLLKTGPGIVISISVNTLAASNATLTVYDGTSASGAVVAVIDCTQKGPDIGVAGWRTQNGIFVALSGTADVTIVYA